MNLLDLIIAIFLLAAAAKGMRLRLMQLLLMSAGLVGGLLLGSLVAGSIALNASDPLKKFLIVITTELVLATLFAAIGATAGWHLDNLARRFRLGSFNRVLGAGLALIFALAFVWLTATAFANVRSYGIGREVRQSLIVRSLNRALPTPPDVLARLEKIITPNGFPNVFIGLEPKHTTVSPSNLVDNQAVIDAENSAVQIKGKGCGGTVFGSGFVVDENVVVTNAHVVAGIASPQVLDASGSYSATPIWFDPDLDVAVLRVSDLAAPPLRLTTGTLPDNDAAAILGFPNGGPLVAEDGVIIDHLTALGRNIYNQGLVSRNIYEVQAGVNPGNSGGPLIARDGTVAGIIFASSLTQTNVGYALMIDDAMPLIQQALQNNIPVNTASCAPV